MLSSKERFLLLRQAGTHALGVILSVALTLTALRAFPTLLIPNSLLKTSEVQAAVPNLPVPLDNNRSFVAAAVNRVVPTVVRIDTERTVATQLPKPFFDNPFFGRFFGEDIFPRLPQEYHQRGQGSGFIIDRNGIILTNAHVVSNADTVTVTFKDGRTFQGKVRGIDEPSDLAVVKIDGQNLPMAPLGNSSSVQVGDWARSPLAIHWAWITR